MWSPPKRTGPGSPRAGHRESPVSGICTLRQDGGLAYQSETCWAPCLMVIGAPDANPLRDMRAPNAKAKRKQR